MHDRFQRARVLAFETGLVNQELLLPNEYLTAENRILRALSFAIITSVLKPSRCKCVHRWCKPPSWDHHDLPVQSKYSSGWNEAFCN